MACYDPLNAIRPLAANIDGERIAPIVIGKVRKDNEPIQPGWERLTLPCGQCIGCKIERSRQWAIRNMHEKQMHESSCMLTLTYAPEWLPWGDSLHLPHFQNFIKRLRRHIAPTKLRFFHCGEYGDIQKRPHYHALLYGYGFPDRTSRGTRNGFPIWGSDTVTRLWSDPKTGSSYGRHEIGDISFESAAYVARYILKKITGARADDHYAGRDPEYVTMSRRPGIGRPWLEKHKTEVYPSDSVIARGIPMRPPRYYDQVWELATDERTWRIQQKIIAQRRAKRNPETETMKHRHDSNVIAETRANLKRREID